MVTLLVVALRIHTRRSRQSRAAGDTQDDEASNYA
jgi:hypothetical protein